MTESKFGAAAADMSKMTTTIPGAALDASGVEGAASDALAASVIAAADAPRLSVKRLAMRGTMWTVGGHAVHRVLRLAAHLVTARLLFPEAYGIMAIVFVFVQGVELLSDLGIGPSVIQNERGDDRAFLNTAWTLQILRGLAVWMCLLLIAWPVASVYQQPELFWLIPVVGLIAIISGFESTAQFTLNRHLALGRLTIMEVGAQAVAAVVMIAWAALSPTVWALVAGALAGKSSRTIWSHLLLPGYRNRPHWDPHALAAIVRFGKWILLASTIGFLGSQVDRLALPLFLPMDVFGVYAVAVMLITLPDQIVTMVGYKVAFPAISKRVHLERAVLRATLLRMRWPVLLAFGCAASLIAAYGDVAVRILYDARYHEAGWMLSLLALGLWGRFLSNTISPALLAIGRPNYFALAGAGRLLMVGIGMPVGHALGGVPATVGVIAAGTFIEYAIEAYGCRRNGLSTLAQDLKASVIWAAMLAVLLLTRSAMGLGLPWDSA